MITDNCLSRLEKLVGTALAGVETMEVVRWFKDEDQGRGGLVLSLYLSLPHLYLKLTLLRAIFRDLIFHIFQTDGCLSSQTLR